jgi:hypothetical protein
MTLMKDLVTLKEGGMGHSEVADIIVTENVTNTRVKEATKAYKGAEALCTEAATLLVESTKKMKSATEDAVRTGKKSCASVKTMVNELKDQITKVDSILGDNVEIKVVQLERIAAALATINEISDDKHTMKVVSAMVSKS